MVASLARPARPAPTLRSALHASCTTTTLLDVPGHPTGTMSEPAAAPGHGTGGALSVLEMFFPDPTPGAYIDAEVLNGILQRLSKAKVWRDGSNPLGGSLLRGAKASVGVGGDRRAGFVHLGSLVLWVTA